MPLSRFGQLQCIKFGHRGHSLLALNGYNNVAEQGMVFRVLSLKKVTPFHYFFVSFWIGSISKSIKVGKEQAT